MLRTLDHTRARSRYFARFFDLQADGWLNGSRAAELILYPGAPLDNEAMRTAALVPAAPAAMTLESHAPIKREASAGASAKRARVAAE